MIMSEHSLMTLNFLQAHSILECYKKTWELNVFNSEARKVIVSRISYDGKRNNLCIFGPVSYGPN